MQSRIVTLTTDFGLRDPYVAEVKAVIARISPRTRVIDITHEVEKFNIRMGAFILAEAAPFFPRGTVHLAVVDPGVGGQRKPIAVQTTKGVFVGPDNGVLMNAARSQKIQAVHEIANPRFTLAPISKTFQGRDIFAPVAAHLAKKTASIRELGPKVVHPLNLSFAKVNKRGNRFRGEVLYVDGFGNVVTSISREDLSQNGQGATAKLKTASGIYNLTFREAYSDVPDGEPVALIGSHGYVELAINQGNAAKNLNLKTGEKVNMEFCPSSSTLSGNPS